jgi:hypothetical protein
MLLIGLIFIYKYYIQYIDGLALGRQHKKQQNGGLRKSMTFPLEAKDWASAARPPAKWRIRETSTKRQSKK